jgi:hypothetical protein
MEKRIDLDAAKAEIDQRIEGWTASGLTVDSVTWRDQGQGWPPPITTERHEVLDADSVGVRLHKGAQEGAVVLFSGGWVDLEYWDGVSADVVQDVPGWEAWLSVEEFGAVLDRLAALFS